VAAHADRVDCFPDLDLRSSVGRCQSGSIKRVTRKLYALIAERGKPGMIVSDNGTELTCNAVLSWCVNQRAKGTPLAGWSAKNGGIQFNRFPRLSQVKRSFPEFNPALWRPEVANRPNPSICDKIPIGN
jgi:hypothetical protein